MAVLKYMNLLNTLYMFLHFLGRVYSDRRQYNFKELFCKIIILDYDYHKYIVFCINCLQKEITDNSHLKS